jgi:hypothetical protein
MLVTQVPKDTAGNPSFPDDYSVLPLSAWTSGEVEVLKRWNTSDTDTDANANDLGGQATAVPDDAQSIGRGVRFTPAGYLEMFDMRVVNEPAEVAEVIDLREAAARKKDQRIRELLGDGLVDADHDVNWIIRETLDSPDPYLAVGSFANPDQEKVYFITSSIAKANGKPQLDPNSSAIFLLVFDNEEWEAFCKGVQNGEFRFPQTEDALPGKATVEGSDSGKDVLPSSWAYVNEERRIVFKDVRAKELATVSSITPLGSVAVDGYATQA